MARRTSIASISYKIILITTIDSVPFIIAIPTGRRLRWYNQIARIRRYGKQCLVIKIFWSHSLQVYTHTIGICSSVNLTIRYYIFPVWGMLDIIIVLSWMLLNIPYSSRRITAMIVVCFAFIGSKERIRIGSTIFRPLIVWFVIYPAFRRTQVIVVCRCSCIIASSTYIIHTRIVRLSPDAAASYYEHQEQRHDET